MNPLQYIFMMVVNIVQLANSFWHPPAFMVFANSASVTISIVSVNIYVSLCLMAVEKWILAGALPSKCSLLITDFRRMPYLRKMKGAAKGSNLFRYVQALSILSTTVGINGLSYFRRRRTSSIIAITAMARCLEEFLQMWS